MTSSVLTSTALPAVILWLVVAYRARLAFTGGSSGALWVALLALAVGQTLRITPISTNLEEALGVPGTVTVVRHATALVAAAAVLIELAHLTADQRSLGRRALLLAGPSAALMLVPFLLDPPTSTHAAMAEQPEWYDQSWASVVHWAGYLAYLAWALVAATSLCFRTRRHASPGPLRTGVTLVGLGTGIGLSYVALKIFMVIAWYTGNGPPTAQFDISAGSGILAFSLIAICLGCSWQTGAQHARTLSNAAATAVALWRLYPLWSLLSVAAPHIVLTPQTRVHRYNFAMPTRLDRLLVDRILEIRDGLLDLRAYAGPRTRTVALEEAFAGGLDGRAAEAVAEAVTLEVGRRAKATGTGIAVADGDVALGGEALLEDSAWLQQVWRAHTSPLIPRLAELIVTREDIAT
jgi:hypothetical protein